MTSPGSSWRRGRGRRFGQPEGPRRLDGERLVDRAVRVLTEGGCDPVFVVLGAWVGDVAGADVVVNDGWPEGMGSSLRIGLEALTAQADVDRGPRHARRPARTHPGRDPPHASTSTPDLAVAATTASAGIR